MPDESVESRREAILTSGVRWETSDEEVDIVDVEVMLSVDEDSGMTELSDPVELDVPKVALDDEMLEDVFELDAVVDGERSSGKYPSSWFGTWMSPVLIASTTSQGSCLCLRVRTLDTELVAGSGIITTCSGRLSSGMEAGLSPQRGFLKDGRETLA